MTESKVPDEKSDWQALDIFLFTNGQDSSPPRKYHLETSELHWWNLTLNYLARAHFGSIHSEIELYSIEGRKIETPMELSHGTAYVAVVPPEPFIDSGYENYLMKASRSWEKGQARRDSTTKLSPSDNHKIRDEESSLDKKYREITNIEGQENNSIDPNKIVASTVQKVTSDLAKPQHAGSKQSYNKTLHGIPAKTPDRRKSIVTQSPLIVKKIGLISSPPAARKSSIKRKDSVKINVSTKNATPTRGSNNFLSNSKLCKQYKQQDTLPDVILSKLEEVTDLKTSSSTKQVCDNSNLSSKSAERKSSIQNKETAVVSTVYRNPRTSLQPSIAIDPQAFLLNNGKMPGLVTELFAENHQNVENKPEEEENELDDSVINIPIHPVKLHPFEEYFTGTEVFCSPKASSNNADKNIDVFNKEETVNLNTFEECFTGTNEPKTPCSADKNIDLSNKEATVNLKLYIEIQNARYDPKADTVPTSKEKGQKIKVEKGSQVYIEEKIAEHTKLHAVICNEIETKDIDGNPNVTIVKCACTSQCGDNCTLNTLPVNIGNSKFVIILPLSNYDERLNRSDLPSEQDQICAEQIERFSIANSLAKRTTSCLSLLRRQIASHGILISSTNLQDLKNDQRDLSMVKHKSVAIREGQNIFSEPSVKEPLKCDSKILYKLASDVSKKDSICQFKTTDNFTQTDLCDMMLEARLNDDGHYSFHVPSLQTLKKYKF